jgi:hypothetical protein
MEIQDAIIKANKDGCSFKRECQTEIEYIIDGHDIYPVIIHSKTRLYTPVILHLYDILANDWIICGQPPQREIALSPFRQVETLVRWRRIDMNNPPVGRVLLLSTSKMVIIGDWYKGMWRTNESFWDKGELKSIYMLSDMTHWMPIPDAPST